MDMSTKHPWLELSERVFPVDRDNGDPRALECRVGPIDNVGTAEDLAAFRACEPPVALELAALLRHPRHRHFVKLLVFATEHVPDALFSEVVLAGVHTLNPSFNKHFIWPCTLVHGRRRVVAELIGICQSGSDLEKAGAARALYWGSAARERIYWPHHQHYTRYQGDPDAPVDDLLADFEEWALAEFIRNDDLDLRRALVSHVPAGLRRFPDLARSAIEIARSHPDPFIRDRLRADLGESPLLPCLPHPTETPGKAAR